MGAGPYRFVGYENGVAAYSANEAYYLGCPQIEILQLHEESYMCILDGQVDISYLHSGIGYEAESATLTEIKVLSADDASYQYIGLNSNTMNVEGEPLSQASQNLRKAFATVLAACRQEAFVRSDMLGGGYSGRIVDYPLSSTSWIVPGEDDSTYQQAYAKDVEGEDIYTSDMTSEERQAAAVRAALGFLKAAGYTVENGVITEAPEGATMTYEARVWCDEESPVLQALFLARDALAKVGMELVVINTMDDETLPYPEPGSCDIWWGMWGDTELAGAWKECGLWEEWYSVADPNAHLYEVYHSSGSQNQVYGVSDPKLDELIESARSTTDQAVRKELFGQCLELIMDRACEVPFCQAEDTLLVYNERVDVDSIADDITFAYSWLRDISNVEML